MPSFPKPPPDSVVYEDKKLYVCLAAQPFAKAHTLVIWKKNVADLHSLSRQDYDHLMHAVEMTRDALLKVYRTKKVYLFYMDEFRHVHWHLIPRFHTTGFKIVLERKIKADFSKVVQLRAMIAKEAKKMLR